MDKGIAREIDTRFEKQNLIYLATAEGDQPRVRPVSLIHLGGNFYIITGARGGRNAAKLNQIKKNPKVEYYLTLAEGEKRGFIRGEATVYITDDPSLKEQLFEEIEWAKDYFKDPTDPDYVLLKLHPITYFYRRPGEYEINRVEI
ncbi:MAG: pyridoxamine 5'-phosphate oxidase family protein [Candidatus Bathyarchaeota archaeon]|jgi:general stress protein 26